MSKSEKHPVLRRRFQRVRERIRILESCVDTEDEGVYGEGIAQLPIIPLTQHHAGYESDSSFSCSELVCFCRAKSLWSPQGIDD